MEINQRNASDQRHGCWEEYHYNDEIHLRTIWYKVHYFNDVEIGYDELYESSGKIIKYKLTWMYGEEIGCELYNNSQRFYKTPGKKFGEDITWKEE